MSGATNGPTSQSTRNDRKLFGQEKEDMQRQLGSFNGWSTGDGMLLTQALLVGRQGLQNILVSGFY